MSVEINDFSIECLHWKYLLELWIWRSWFLEVEMESTHREVVVLSQPILTFDET